MNTHIDYRMKAAILAAGEGRRLWPLTKRRPKPMLPVGNRPLLEYVIEAVTAAGIDEIILVVGYQRDRIQTYFGDGNQWNVDIEYVVQDRQLGTGHAVAQLESHVDGPFLVLNGDRLIEQTLVETVRDAPKTNVATVGVTRVADPQQYGVVTTDGDRLLDIEEKPTQSTSQIINAGVYRLSPSIFEAIEHSDPTADGEIALTSALSDLAVDKPVGVVRYSETWTDVSQLWDLLAVNDSVVARRDCQRAGSHHETAVVSERVCTAADSTVAANATVHRATTLGTNVTVGPGAVVSNAVVFPDATIGPGAVVADCIVGQNATIGPNTTITGGDATVVVDGQQHTDITLGAVIGDNTKIGGGSVIEPGTIIGDGSTVGNGAVVDGRLDAETTVVR